MNVFDIMKAIKIKNPVEPGTIVKKNIAGTEVDLIATWSVLERREE